MTMYVLMDLEWVTNKQLHFSPTQIGAMRVNDAWEQQSVFYSRIRPRDASFYTWKHIGYTGGTALDYLHSPGIHHVLSKLEEWLLDDDVICIWAKDAKNILKSSYNLVLNKKVAQRIVIIGDYVYPLLKETGIQKGDAHRIASIYGVDAPKPKHHSENDVTAMQLALKAIGFSPELFLNAPPKKSTDASQEIVVPKALNNWSENAPYQYDRKARIIHKKGCSEIPSDADLLGYDTLRIALSKHYEVCPACLASEIKIANKQRNQDIINRTEYNFVYADNSEVFHRRDCGLILATHGVIRGSVYYNTCAETGRRACKCCSPSPDKLVFPSKKIKLQSTKTPSAIERSMTREEQTSLARFKQAQKERYTRQPEQFDSETAKEDFYLIVEIICCHMPATFEWGEYLDILDTMFFNLIHEVLHNKICSVLTIFRIYHNEIITVQETRIIMIDRMSIECNSAVFCLTENLVKLRGGNNLAPYHLSKHVARPHRRKLIWITDKQKLDTRFQTVKQRMCQPHIDHTALIYYNKISR